MTRSTIRTGTVGRVLRAVSMERRGGGRVSERLWYDSLGMIREEQTRGGSGKALG